MSIKIAVIQFPGSNCDLDTLHVLNNVIADGIEAELIWHNHFKESKFDGCILPGGFSFGDYLRAGIIAAHSPALDEARIMLKDGRPIIGICNGFQILTEAQFLPGALLRNESLKFICKWVKMRVQNTNTPFTHTMNNGDIINTYECRTYKPGFSADEKYVMLGYPRDTIYFVQTDNGDVLWKKSLEGQSYSKPFVAKDGRAIFYTDGYLLDKNSNIIWQNKMQLKVRLEFHH